MVREESTPSKISLAGLLDEHGNVFRFSSCLPNFPLSHDDEILLRSRADMVELSCGVYKKTTDLAMKPNQEKISTYFGEEKRQPILNTPMLVIEYTLKIG